MIITEIKIQLIRPNDGLIGFASVVIYDNVYLGGIGIHRKVAGGYRLTYPKKDGFDIFYPITRDAGQIIETAIFEKLKSVMKGIENDRHNRIEHTDGRI